jgi:diguanylate cyclase (GGDEF)-like protein
VGRDQSARPVALVVDDDPDIRELVSLHLGSLGYEAVEAADGEQALALARARPPEIALVDVGLPGIDGLALTRALLAEPGLDVAVLLLSARVSERDVEGGFDAGAADYLRKPFSPRELAESVRRVAGERALRRSEEQAARRAEQGQSLRRVATSVARGDDPETVFGLVAEEAARLFDADAGAVFRFVGDRARTVGSYARESVPRRAHGLELPLDGDSATALVARSGRAMRRDHLHRTDDGGPTATPRRFGSALGAPIHVGERLWGSLSVAALRTGAFAPGDERGLAEFAELLDLAVAGAEAKAELSRRARQEQALRRVATAVAAEAAPDEVFGLVAAEAGRALGAEAAEVVRYARGRDHSGMVVGAWRARRGPARAVPGVPAWEAPVPRETASAAVRPGGRPWGTITVMGAGVSDAASALQGFADLVGMALANADARGQLRRLASTDYLTGLPNARAFHERLAEEAGRARRYERPLSLVIMDLDHFKEVNDTYGHAVGDQVLTELARRLDALVRGGEMVARIGGEEFAWILPETDGAGAVVAAERARRAIAGSPFPIAGRRTLSAGVCDLGDCADAGELFRRADLALYWAKRGGRDRCERYSAKRPHPLSAEGLGGTGGDSGALGAILAMLEGRGEDSQGGSGSSISSRPTAP